MIRTTQPEKYFVKKILEWGQDNRRSFPWRENPSPYNVFISEFFLQRTPAERVAVFFPEFLKKYPSIDLLAMEDQIVLEVQLKPLGLTKRVIWLLNSAKAIKEKFHGKIPDDYEQLKSLPGIGQYTASAILCFAYRQDIGIVDANVIRIINSFFNIDSSSRLKNDKIHSIANSLIPCNQGVFFNQILLDFTAVICKSKPECKKCPLIRKCMYLKKQK